MKDICKAIFKINKHIYKVTELSVSHAMDLFDKLITQILNYSSEVWGFDHGKAIERVHLQFVNIYLKLYDQPKTSLCMVNLAELTFNVCDILIL